MEQPAISSDLIRGHIDTIILHSLINGDKFPQQISDFIEEKSENKYQIIQATLYSSLKRLESSGYVMSYRNESENGRRKFFKITEKGQELVDANLSSWSYSRSIIDKLMDLEPSPIVKTEYIVKEVVKEVPIEIQVPAQMPILTQASNEVQNEVSPVEKSENTYVNTRNDEEINFRNLLSGLIKNSTTNSESEVITPIKMDEKPLEMSEKVAFNETIEQVDYSVEKAKFSGKIDFSDLVAKAKEDGYKLKVSSNEPISFGKVLRNKLNFVSSICIFILLVIQAFILTQTKIAQTGFSTKIAIISSAVMLVFPLICLAIWIQNRNKTSLSISGDSMFVAAIVVFNLCLITFAGNLISGIDLENLSIIAYSAIIPIIVFLNIFIYFVIRFALSKLKIFTVR